MTLENISGRDKIWFHPTVNLRQDTASGQLLRVLVSFREILTGHPKVETGKMPVRFISVGAYSLDVEVAAYVTTYDNDEFLEIQQGTAAPDVTRGGKGRNSSGCAVAGELRIATGATVLAAYLPETGEPERLLAFFYGHFPLDSGSAATVVPTL